MENNKEPNWLAKRKMIKKKYKLSKNDYSGDYYRKPTKLFSSIAE